MTALAWGVGTGLLAFLAAAARRDMNLNSIQWFTTTQMKQQSLTTSLKR
jgi:hypothetical protein